MFLPEKKEREYRFKLALRIGLPIFALVIALLSSAFITTYDSLHTSFFIESILLLAFSIYFIFYIIYNGFDEKITDPVSKTFSREYLFKYLEKELKNKQNYTLLLVSIDNLSDINTIYGLKNGDKTLEVIANWIGNYLLNQKIENAPIGHIKGGDFVIGIDGGKEKYTTMLELMCIKANEFNIDNIEIKISGAIIDTNYSKELNYLLEHLFEIQEINKKKKNNYIDEKIDPNEFETLVIQALKHRDIQIESQDVYKDREVSFCEYHIKLLGEKDKLLYPKRYKKVLNKLGLIVEYEKMIIEELILNPKININDNFAINLSASSLRNEVFLSFLKNLLQNNQKKYKKIFFIISEQEYYSFTGRFNSIINSLKNFNVFIVVDRVGSYHSSFLYLRELDINMVRFDSYYSNKEKLQENSSIVEGLNLMAQKKGLQTWIKNIEDKEVLENLENLGIDYIQGRYLSELEIIYKK
jgi:EAL domain-containing protein (putative c-di-GMP-specific phosphodiesterase class I)